MPDGIRYWGDKNDIRLRNGKIIRNDDGRTDTSLLMSRCRRKVEPNDVPLVYHTSFPCGSPQSSSSVWKYPPSYPSKISRIVGRFRTARSVISPSCRDRISTSHPSSSFAWVRTWRGIRTAEELPQRFMVEVKENTSLFCISYYTVYTFWCQAEQSMRVEFICMKLNKSLSFVGKK